MVKLVMSGLVVQTMLVCNEAQKGAGRCEKAIDEVIGFPSWDRGRAGPGWLGHYLLSRLFACSSGGVFVGSCDFLSSVLLLVWSASSLLVDNGSGSWWWSASLRLDVCGVSVGLWSAKYVSAGPC